MLVEPTGGITSIAAWSEISGAGKLRFAGSVYQVIVSGSVAKLDMISMFCTQKYTVPGPNFFQWLTYRSGGTA